MTRTALSLAAHVASGSDWLIPPPSLAAGGGFALWLAVYYLLPSPVRTYVLAHELTHALWGVVMGARVRDIRVGRSGGYVALTKTNVLISLSPYFFPLYTMLLIAAYALLSCFRDMRPYYLLWLGLVGFTWGFHFTFTLTSLLQRQPDIEENGRLFSYAVIYLFNVLGLCLWTVAVTSVTLWDLVHFLWTHAAAVAMALRHAAEAVLGRAGG